MISKLFRSAYNWAGRNFSTTSKNFKRYKVAVIGSAGGVGQNVSFLLKLNPSVFKISMFDVAEHVKGVAIDVSHVATQPISKGYKKDELFESLECCNIVIITPGGKRKPNMRREDHWNHNAKIVSEIARAAAKICPECFIEIISNPINSLVPLVCEIFKQECAYHPGHIFGLTMIDESRSRVFASEILGISPECIKVPLIGGHSNASIIPVWSQCQPPLDISEEKMKALYQKVALAGETVVRAKYNKTATLAMAHCASEFTNALIKGLNCEPNIRQIAYVPCDALGTKFCVSEFLLSGDGIAKFFPQPKLNAYEEQLLNMGLPDIKKHVKRAEDYAAKINPYKKAEKVEKT